MGFAYFSVKGIYQWMKTPQQAKNKPENEKSSLMNWELDSGSWCDRYQSSAGEMNTLKLLLKR